VFSQSYEFSVTSNPCLLSPLGVPRGPSSISLGRRTGISRSGPARYNPSGVAQSSQTAPPRLPFSQSGLSFPLYPFCLISSLSKGPRGLVPRFAPSPPFFFSGWRLGGRVPFSEQELSGFFLVRLSSGKSACILCNERSRPELHPSFRCLRQWLLYDACASWGLPVVLQEPAPPVS